MACKCKKADLHEFDCVICDKNTIEMGEYYMVRDDVWFKATENWEGMLCIECLEDMLGRKLKPRDFTHCPLNDRWETCKRSDRLLDRLGPARMVPSARKYAKLLGVRV